MRGQAADYYWTDEAQYLRDYGHAVASSSQLVPLVSQGDAFTWRRLRMPDRGSYSFNASCMENPYVEEHVFPRAAADRARDLPGGITLENLREAQRALEESAIPSEWMNQLATHGNTYSSFDPFDDDEEEDTPVRQGYSRAYFDIETRPSVEFRSLGELYSEAQAQIAAPTPVRVEETRVPYRTQNQLIRNAEEGGWVRPEHGHSLNLDREERNSRYWSGRSRRRPGSGGQRGERGVIHEHTLIREDNILDYMSVVPMSNREARARRLDDMVEIARRNRSFREWSKEVSATDFTQQEEETYGMHYKFPHIQCLADVLSVIKGRDEFIVAEKDGYTVINYVKQTNDTFPVVKNNDEAILRECRGLVFCNETQDILSRGFHKFFNQNEREETTDIDLSRQHYIMEKLDGSMIRPLFLHEATEPRWITKMGITDVAMQVENFVVGHSNYVAFAKACHKKGLTPIFEWCSLKQRIVLPYDEDQLILTAVRNTTTGHYMDYETMTHNAAVFDIPVVQLATLEDVAAREGEEGVVVAFDSGQRYKVKSDWYVLRHRSLDAVKHEKNILELVIDDGIDDLLPLVDDITRAHLTKYRDAVISNIEQVAGKTMAMAVMLKQAAEYDVEKREDYNELSDEQVQREIRKAYAKLVNVEGMNDLIRPIFFRLLDGKGDALTLVKEVIRKNLGSQAAVDGVRPLLRGVKWVA